MFSFAKYLIKHDLSKLAYQRFAQCSSDTIQSRLNHCERVQNVSHQTYGQPTPSTHPHLLKDGEVTPGIQLGEYKSRRAKLIERIIADGYEKNLCRPQIVIIPSSSKVYMSDKIPYVFRQNTDFLYFTGCQEPDSALVITARDNNFMSTLFMQQKDERSELWDGPRTGVHEATELFGVDQSLPTTEFDRFIASLIKQHRDSVIWYDDASTIQPSLHNKICQVVKTSEGQPFTSLMKIIHNIRLIKSQSEIALMQKSCQIASAAIQRTISASRPGITEHKLFAIVDYECRMNGAEFLAYPPVVAGGKNANIIHYINNNQVVQDGEMVLMDAGCEYHGYTSDVTRTWPINGTFSPEQRILYEIVFEVQSLLIQSLQDMPTLDKLFRNMCQLLGKRLQEVNLIPKSLSDDKLLSATYSYCPHHVSHFLGMDVHDTGKVPGSTRIRPGMIITMEPGIYVNPRNTLAPPEFYGIGIRIEDDILITDKDPVVLTKSCPRQIHEIEALASQNQR